MNTIPFSDLVLHVFLYFLSLSSVPRSPTFSLLGTAMTHEFLPALEQVAYYKNASAILGSSEFSYRMITDDCRTGSGNATCVPRFASEFYFVSEKNRNEFAANPWAFAPVGVLSHRDLVTHLFRTLIRLATTIGTIIYLNLCFRTLARLVYVPKRRWQTY